MARLRLSRLLPHGGAPPPGARIILGLGNPGSYYAQHRHNVGARSVAVLSEMLRIPLQKRARLYLCGEGQTPNGPLVLAQPRTYMNESGRAVQALLTTYRADPAALIVIVDDIDLPVGRVRVRAGGGDAGQKGMRSIKEGIGTLEFPRVRIGIGRPLVDGKPSWDPEAVADYVLADPPPEEARLLAQAERRAAEAVLAILREGVEAAMNRSNTGNGDAPPVDP